MEITDRVDLGLDLRAPKTDSRGQDSWSYSLVTHVRPGDRVFHWYRPRGGEPSILGWSTAAGPLQTISMTWQAHGSAGRSKGAPEVGPGWSMPLAGFTAFPEPVTRTRLNDRRLEVLEVLRRVEFQAQGRSYAPFQHYGGRELRAQQAYLTKFPAALVDLLLPGFDRVEDHFGFENYASGNWARSSRAQGYQSDAALRSAIEAAAVRLAVAHYESIGATEIQELGRPYDLRVVIDGIERHVEVKGSTGNGVESVQLTQGEVDHARSWQPTDLFVVDELVVGPGETEGALAVSGGRVRLWEGWQPAESHLQPTHLRYTLPKAR